MVAELQAARDALSRQGEATGRLRLTAPMSFGSTHLAPVLAELAVRHPRLEISTSYSDRLVDLVGEGFDAAVRLGNLADSSLIARRIAPVRAVLVASPAYLARRRHAADAGRPRRPRRDPARRPDLAVPARRADAITHRPRGRFTADSGAAELAGVVAGLGIAMMPAFLAGPAIERGEIVTLLDDYEIPRGRPLHRAAAARRADAEQDQGPDRHHGGEVRRRRLGRLRPRAFASGGANPEDGVVGLGAGAGRSATRATGQPGWNSEEPRPKPSAPAAHQSAKSRRADAADGVDERAARQDRAQRLQPVAADQAPAGKIFSASAPGGERGEGFGGREDPGVGAEAELPWCGR